MSPTCCEASERYKTVTFFVPAAQSTPGHWVVPFRGDEGEVVERGCTPAKYCPFCGVALGREHVPFEVR